MSGRNVDNLYNPRYPRNIPLTEQEKQETKKRKFKKV